MDAVEVGTVIIIGVGVVASMTVMFILYLRAMR